MIDQLGADPGGTGDQGSSNRGSADRYDPDRSHSDRGHPARTGRAWGSSDPGDAAQPTALALNGITRRFGRVLALERASMTVASGTVHALVGENGAGKTTLMRVAFGMIKPTGGSIEVRGRTVQFSSPADALAEGIGMVHQHFTLVPAMTVAENVALGGRGRFSVKQWAEKVRAIGERTGLVLDPMARAGDLPISAQQRCEIVKALARDVQLLILDEPTAVLAPDEAQDLLRWMQSYANSGRAIVLITHKLRDAMAVARDITVLRMGKSVFTATASSTSEDELAASMLGIEVLEHRQSPHSSATATASAAPRSATTDTTTTRSADAVSALPPVLRVQAASARDARGVVRLDNVSLNVHAGEIVGVAAVEGAGQRELLRLLSGRLKPETGSVVLPARIGFVPEDRHNDALMLDSPLVDNIALRDAGARAGRMPWQALRNATSSIVAERDVRAAGIDVDARTLSGGNQQKLIVGREMAEQPQALIVENPTRGLDFRATQAVHTALTRARRDGAAVVVYSSDLDEVLLLSDRVVVMHGGVLSEVPRDRVAIGRAMLGS